MTLQPDAVIHIKDMKIRAVIGTGSHERETPQELLLNVSFQYDAALAAQSDALGHAVDYASIHGKITERVPSTKFFLLERLAGFILDIIMEDPKVAAAEVVLEKFGVLPGAASVSVKMSAERTGPKTISTTRCY